MSQRPALMRRPEYAGRAGRAGLVATGISVSLTFVVAVAGTSIMEPPYPGRPGQPPWAVSAHLSPYLAVALAGGALAVGTMGLALTISAMRRGWVIPARPVLLAGLVAAALLTLVPPVGSSDPLSYAAYGRMLVSGHNPYAIGPDVLARLGIPWLGRYRTGTRHPRTTGPSRPAARPSRPSSAARPPGSPSSSCRCSTWPRSPVPACYCTGWPAATAAARSARPCSGRATRCCFRYSWPGSTSTARLSSSAWPRSRCSAARRTARPGARRWPLRPRAL